MKENLRHEIEENHHLKEENADLQKTTSLYEKSNQDVHRKYQELIEIKSKLENDLRHQKSLYEQELIGKETLNENSSETESKYVRDLNDFQRKTNSILV